MQAREQINIARRILRLVLAARVFLFSDRFWIVCQIVDWSVMLSRWRTPIRPQSNRG
jgi:hypothetical protein